MKAHQEDINILINCLFILLPDFTAAYSFRGSVYFSRRMPAFYSLQKQRLYSGPHTASLLINSTGCDFTGKILAGPAVDYLFFHLIMRAHAGNIPSPAVWKAPRAFCHRMFRR